MSLTKQEEIEKKLKQGGTEVNQNNAGGSNANVIESHIRKHSPSPVDEMLYGSNSSRVIKLANDSN